MTFLEQQTRVGNNINQAVTDDTLFITETEVKAWINDAQDELETMQWWPFLITEESLDTVADQNYLALSGLTATYRPGGAISAEVEDYLCVGVGEREWARLQQGTTASGRPSRFRIWNDRIYFWPTPSTSTTDGLVFRFYALATDLSDDTDVSEMPVPFHHAMVEYATMMAFRKKGEQKEADRYEARWNARLPKLTEQFGSEFRGGFPVVKARSQEQPINPNDYPQNLTQA